MPAATALRKREEIIHRHQEGERFAEIAREMQIPYMTVRGICKHYERTGHIQPNYAGCAKPGVRKDVAIFERAIHLKKAHPRWGAGLIWVELAEEFEEEQLPSERTLQRWFRQAGVANRDVSEKRVVSVIQRGEVAHEVWAMDAKEEIPLADGTYASWLVISDEGSGSVLHTDVFPPQTLVNRRGVAGETQHSNGS
jgi:transposase